MTFPSILPGGSQEHISSISLVVFFNIRCPVQLKHKQYIRGSVSAVFVCDWPSLHVCNLQENLLLPPPLKAMGGYVFAGVGMQVDIQQTTSVIPMATGDEVIKFWKVKVSGEGMRSTDAF